jgi:hypothetical protein
LTAPDLANANRCVRKFWVLSKRHSPLTPFGCPIFPISVD